MRCQNPWKTDSNDNHIPYVDYTNIALCITYEAQTLQLYVMCIIYDEHYSQKAKFVSSANYRSFIDCFHDATK